MTTTIRSVTPQRTYTPNRTPRPNTNNKHKPIGKLKQNTKAAMATTQMKRTFHQMDSSVQDNKPNDPSRKAFVDY